MMTFSHSSCCFPAKPCRSIAELVCQSLPHFLKFMLPTVNCTARASLLLDPSSVTKPGLGHVCVLRWTLGLDNPQKFHINPMVTCYEFTSDQLPNLSFSFAQGPSAHAASLKDYPKDPQASHSSSHRHPPPESRKSGLFHFLEAHEVHVSEALGCLLPFLSVVRQAISGRLLPIICQELDRFIIMQRKYHP